MEEDDSGPLKKMYMHIGGEWVVVRSGALTYVNGKKVYAGKYDLDYLDWKGIWEMYRVAGGKGNCVTFYYKHPSLPMTDEHAVRHIWGTWSFVEIQNTHPVSNEVLLYSVREYDGIHAAFEADGTVVQLSQERDDEEPETIKFLTFPGWPPPQQAPEPVVEPIETQNADSNESQTSARRKRTTDEEQELVQLSVVNETLNMDHDHVVQPSIVNQDVEDTSNLNDEAMTSSNLNEDVEDTSNLNDEAVTTSNLNETSNMDHDQYEQPCIVNQDFEQTSNLNDEPLQTSNHNETSNLDDDQYAFLHEQFNINLGEDLSFHEAEQNAIHEEPQTVQQPYNKGKQTQSGKIRGNRA